MVLHYVLVDGTIYLKSGLNCFSSLSKKYINLFYRLLINYYFETSIFSKKEGMIPSTNPLSLGGV